METYKIYFLTRALSPYARKMIRSQAYIYLQAESAEEARAEFEKTAKKSDTFLTIERG